MLESDESLLNPNWTGDLTSPHNTISFDGQGKHSLILEKNSDGGKTSFIQVGTNSAKHTGSNTVSFENLENLSLKNSDAESSKGEAISIYQKEGNGKVEFSNIAGNVAIEGFRAEPGKSPVLVVSDKGKSTISFSDIGGNISISDNKATSSNPIGGGALTAWVEATTVTPYTPYKAFISFSNVKGDINFSGNASQYAGGAIHAVSFLGQAQVDFSNIQGNTTFTGNSAGQGGAIHIQGYYDSSLEDVALTYTNSTGDVTFSNNSASSGGAVSVTGISQTIKFSNLKGNVVFEGNSATTGGGAILLGDHTLGAVLPMAEAYTFPGYTRNVYARLEFSNIEGDVIFRNNSVNTTEGGGKGGAIYVADTFDETPTNIVLSADKGNITFSGNTVDHTANAIHLHGQMITSLRAQEGYSVNFYDPITTNTGTLATREKYPVSINKAENGTTYDGRVVFSGAHINAETLGGDAATLDARLAASKTSKINGNIFVYDGTLAITDGAIVHCNSARLLAGSTLEITNGGELKLSLNGTSNQRLFVDAGAILMSGDTTLSSTGDGSLHTSTGISGSPLQIADGAIVGTFVHDTGKITKADIISSIKEGFNTNTSKHTTTKYLYQIGKNVELDASASVSGNEILNCTDGGNVTVATIEAGGHVYTDKGGSVSVASIADGGTLSVSSGTVEITAQESSTLGSFSQNGTETTTAQIRVDSSSAEQSVINAVSTNLKAVENETTTINSNTTVIAKSVEVSSSQAGQQTTLVNDGTINSQVNVSGDGAIIKGSGTFGGGLTVTSGGTLIVGNSPGFQIYTNSVNLSGSQVIFSVDGLQQSTQTANGWGSGTYSNLLMTQGTFSWDAATTLGLELSSSLTRLSAGTAIELVFMTFNVGNDSATSVSEITLGNQAIWNGTIYKELVGNPIDIEILLSLAQGETGPELVNNLENSKLVSSYDEEKGIVTVSLQGQIAPVAVPEASTSMLGLLGFSLLLFRRRK